jgi:hypothetical protein
MAMRRSTSAALILTCLAIDAFALVGAVWSLVFHGLARGFLLFQAVLLTVLWLLFRLVLFVASPRRSELTGAFRDWLELMAGLGVAALVPLAAIALHARLGVSKELTGVIALLVMALHVVTYLRLLVASGSADHPYVD